MRRPHRRVHLRLHLVALRPLHVEGVDRPGCGWGGAVHLGGGSGATSKGVGLRLLVRLSAGHHGCGRLQAELCIRHL